MERSGLRQLAGVERHRHAPGGRRRQARRATAPAPSTGGRPDAPAASSKDPAYQPDGAEGSGAMSASDATERPSAQLLAPPSSSSSSASSSSASVLSISASSADLSSPSGSSVGTPSSVLSSLPPSASAPASSDTSSARADCSPVPTIATPVKTPAIIVPDTVIKISSAAASHDESTAAVETLLRKELEGKALEGWEIPKVLSKRDVDRILTRLEREGKIVDGQWLYKGLVAILGTGETEASMQAPLLSVLNDITDCVKGKGTEIFSARWRYQGDHTTPNAAGASPDQSKAKPDLVCFNIRGKQKDHHLVPWTALQCFGELKPKEEDDSAQFSSTNATTLQIARYARKLSEAQPGLIVCHGLTVCRTRCRIWRFDARNVWRSRPFDLHRDRAQLVQALAFLSSTNANVGFPATTFALQLRDALTEYSWLAPPVALFASASLFGRRTAVFCGKLRWTEEAGSVDSTAIVKVSHTGDRLREHEARIVAKLADSGVFGSQKVLCRGQLMVPVGGVSTPQVLAFAHQGLRPVYVPRADVNPIPIADLCKAFRDATRGLAGAFKICGIHHRDVSLGNIMLGPEGGGRTAEEEAVLASDALMSESRILPFGFIIDWGNSREHGQRRGEDAATANADPRSGTLAFLSRRMLRTLEWSEMRARATDPDIQALLDSGATPHDLRDDLESLFYVFIYALSARLNGLPHASALQWRDNGGAAAKDGLFGSQDLHWAIFVLQVLKATDRGKIDAAVFTVLSELFGELRAVITKSDRAHAAAAASPPVDTDSSPGRDMALGFVVAFNKAIRGLERAEQEANETIAGRLDDLALA